MTELMQRMLQAGSIKNSSILAESSYFNMRDSIKTDLPILNVAFSGSLDGGMPPGLTIFAGQSKSFKTLLGLYCMKAYFEKYPDAICLFYDSEFGTPPAYISGFGIDSKRIIHIPIEHVEQLKFDIVKRLEQITRGDKVFIFVDSLGNLASKKEVEDAVEEKAVADMSRAKSIRSFLRIITPHLTTKDLPCIIINHVYQTMELYSKTVIPGGTAVTYAANQIFVISKAKEQDSNKETIGHKFTINIEKSRYVKEGSKLPFIVTYEDGVKKWSGLFEIALDGKFIKEVSKGWYSTGSDKKLRRGEIESDDSFWNELISTEEFKTHIENSYRSVK